MNIDDRQLQLNAWLQQQGYTNDMTLHLLAGGASFRRFFRMQYQGMSYIVMDEPDHQTDNCQRYVQVARDLSKIGLQVPQIIAVEHVQGFVLKSDLGDQIYHRILTKDNAHVLYSKALDLLVTLQSHPLSLPIFDREIMQFAMSGFQEYFLEKYLGIHITSDTQKMLDNTFDLLINNALQQPQVPMHRDYHSQNILLLENGRVGIVDFQDAKIGPITYDAVSCLRDCYIDWPIEWVDQWINDFYQRLIEKKILNAHVSLGQFIYWFDLMGIERHLKACFTFARKFIRDHDDSYLQYIPRTLKYVHQNAQKYPELAPFLKFFENEIVLENI